MARYDLLEARRVILSNVQTDSNYLISILVNLSYELGLPRGEMSDFEQCSNRLQLDLISHLVNFSYELNNIVNIYVFLVVRFVITPAVNQTSALIVLDGFETPALIPTRCTRLRCPRLDCPRAC